MPGTGFYTLDEESWDRFSVWLRSQAPEMLQQMEPWLQWLVVEPERPPAKLIGTETFGLDRLEYWSVVFERADDQAEIVFLVNLSKATITFVRP